MRALLLLLLAAWSAPPASPLEGVTRTVEVLEGESATLTCDTALPSQGDTLLLLVWYKNSSGDQLAVFSYDSRAPATWLKEELDGRAAPGAGAAPGAELVLTRAAAADQGLFHCRVDFLLSPTRNSYVDLVVIILPQPPFIKNEVGDKMNGTLGHYHEGDTLILTCYVIGGRPPPQISWYSGAALLDATDGDSLTLNMRENELYLPLTREHRAAPLQCRAANTHLAAPQVCELQLDIYVSAAAVAVWWDGAAAAEDGLRAGRRATARCRASGAYPQPALAWWLDQHQVAPASTQEWDAGTLTAESRLELSPSRRQRGSSLSCVATNELLAPASATKAATVILNVTYSPAVQVSRLGAGRANESEEGRPLRLRCEVDANPPAAAVVWYFNDVEVTSLELFRAAAGAGAGGATLQVAAASRLHAGRYSCRASNALGEGRSEELRLLVTYPPECVGAGVRLAAETVRCDTAAVPAPDTFLWRARAGADTQRLTTAAPELRLSLLQGPLDAPLQVWCEASSAAGAQRQACSATLLLQHLRPAPPHHCDISYQLEAFHVHCRPGGNATYHVLSVWRMSPTNSSLVLVWRARSAFDEGASLVGGAVGALGPGDEAGVEACNVYGCSAHTLLRPTAELLLAAAPPWWKGVLEKDLGVSVGIVVLVAAFAVTSLVLTRLVGRYARAKPPPPPPPPVIQVLQLDEFTARDYIDTLERKSRSHKSCSSVYSGGSLEECPPLVERARKPLLWLPQARSGDCLPDLTAQFARESAV